MDKESSALKSIILLCGEMEEYPYICFLKYWNISPLFYTMFQEIEFFIRILLKTSLQEN